MLAAVNPPAAGLMAVHSLSFRQVPGMVSDTERLIPELYREAAEELRQLARRARLTDARGHLLELSAQFQRQAGYADAAIRLGAPGYPHGELLPITEDPL